VFGREIDDPAIDVEFDQLVEDALSERKRVVRLPVQLALAMFMRPRGHGRKRPPKERVPARAEGLAVLTAEGRWAELVAEGIPSKKAKHDAAREAHQKFGQSARVGVATIKRQMRLSRAKADIAK
jgi:hypothetical protein